MSSVRAAVQRAAAGGGRAVTVTIELGDTEYELEVSHFERAEAPSRRGHPDSWDAGSGGEVEVEDTVKVWGLVSREVAPGAYNAVPGVVELIPLSSFLVHYQEYHDLPDLKVAETKLLEEVYEDVARQQDEDFDDRY